jgi:hypothetical protein
MRRLIAFAGLALILALAPAACTKKKKAASTGGAADGQPASVVNVADTNTSAQLTRGFYGVEADSWRWTMKNFSMALHPPKGADQKGATLQLSFAIPDVIFNRLGTLTLNARVNGVDVGSQTFDKAGAQTFKADVPSRALGAEVVAVDFSLDKALPPGEQDQRELGVVVSSAGLITK